jgi:hypothetical protein
MRAATSRSDGRLARFQARKRDCSSGAGSEQLSALPDGRIAYDLRHPWSNDTTRLVFEPLTFLE